MVCKSRNFLMFKTNSISVICPFHRNENNIIRAAKSIFSQTYLPDEIIFVNDNSPDQSYEILTRFLDNISIDCMIKIISLDHSGPGHARNVAIQKSSSEWISFLDADDYWLPEKLENVIRIIQNNNLVNFVAHDEFSYKRNYELENCKISNFYNKDKDLSYQLFMRNFLSTSACTVSNNLVREFLFDPYLSSCQDYELWLAMSQKIILHYIKKPLGFYDNYNMKSITNNNQIKRLKNLILVLFRYHKYVNIFEFIFILSKHLTAFFIKIVKN